MAALRLHAALIALVMATAGSAYAQVPPPPYGYPPPPPSSDGPAQGPLMAPEQLDQSLAPVALYPDPLLTDVLTAATYPLEVVDAARWLQSPGAASLRGPALTDALAQQNWDPSVKSLVPFPQIVAMMDAHLDWMQSIGNAFLEQQNDVMDSVQRLRQQAAANGTLQSTPQQSVNNEGGYIVILPASPTVIYVPVYDTRVVYGRWRYPSYQPYYWGPPPGLRVAATVGGIGFSIGFGVVDALWGWGDWDWAHHDVRVDPARFNRINRGRPEVSATVWQHAPDHRHGVPYGGAQSRSQFQPAVTGSPADRQNFRGFANTPQAQSQDRNRAAAPAQQNREAAPATRNREAAPAPALQATPQARQAPETRDRGGRDRTPEGRQAPAAQPQAAQPPAAVQRQAEPARPQAVARPAAAPEAARQAPARPPTAFQSFGGGHARDDAQRGQESRQQAPAARAAAPAAQPRPVEAARPAPAPRPVPAPRPAPAAAPARPALAPAPAANPAAPAHPAPGADEHHGREH